MENHTLTCCPTCCNMIITATQIYVDHAKNEVICSYKCVQNHEFYVSIIFENGFVKIKCGIWDEATALIL